MCKKEIQSLSRDEQISIIISQFSRHERMDEVAIILSTLTSYKITNYDYSQYYCGLVDEEIEKRINNAILNNINENVLQEEENAWNSIINALGIETIFEIMDNWKKYVKRNTKICNFLFEAKKRMYIDLLLDD